MAQQPNQNEATVHHDTDDADLNVRDKIISRLEKGTYECCVCVDVIRSSESIWTCNTCYSLVHLSCLKEWAASSEEKGSWRCPGCSTEQRVNYKRIEYKCFCNQTTNPVSSGYSTPHSCELICNKIRRGTPCPHKCTDRCHPGPCRPCHLMSELKYCYCGAVTYRTGCSEVDSGKKCDSVCNKRLSCGLHFCKQKCHPGDCQSCEVTFEQTCFCGRSGLTALPCNAAPTSQPETEMSEMEFKEHSLHNRATYSCGAICGNKLGCDSHTCKLPCHFGNCEDCELLPEKVSHCSCGKTDLAKIASAKSRSKCTDTIPTCSLTCGRGLDCGTHNCVSKCHNGDCSECQQQVLLKCQCAAKSVLVTCSDSRKANGTTIHPAVIAKKEEEFSIFSGKKGSKKKKNNASAAPPAIKLPFSCQSRCQTTKICGKHSCLETCCPTKGGIHICEYKCGKKLSCGIHKCDSLCHVGGCGRCLNSSFEELSCSCGCTVITPPVPCGTPPPRCTKPCGVKKECGHTVNHNCHFGDCPPCSEMVFKNCIAHDIVSPWPVPCHTKEVTCGTICHQYLNCTRHVCRKSCHKGTCDPCDGICYSKLKCEHFCAVKCHAGECPSCTEDVRLSCKCGYNLKDVPCHSTAEFESPLPCLPECSRG